MNDDSSLIHRVPGRVLAVAEDVHRRAVHKGAQVVAGRAVNVDFKFGAQPAADVTLPVDVAERVLSRLLTNNPVEFRILHIVCVYMINHDLYASHSFHSLQSFSLVEKQQLRRLQHASAD